MGDPAQTHREVDASTPGTGLHCDQLHGFAREVGSMKDELIKDASALLDAMETCHDCGGTLLIDDGAAHCEDCSSGCEHHDPPDCIGIDVLHARLRRAVNEARTHEPSSVIDTERSAKDGNSGREHLIRSMHETLGSEGDTIHYLLGVIDVIRGDRKLARKRADEAEFELERERATSKALADALRETNNALKLWCIVVANTPSSQLEAAIRQVYEQTRHTTGPAADAAISQYEEALGASQERKS